MKRLVIRGLFLPGDMDELDDTIGAEYSSWFLAPFVTSRLIRAFKAGKLKGPVDIIGHSLGANSALNQANRLGDAGMEIGLVVLLDPTYTNRLKYGRGFAFLSHDFRAKPVHGARVFHRPDLDHMGLTTDPEIIQFIKDNLS